MNIDDSLRNSFDPDSFEFNEAHWEQASAMLDKDFAQRAYYKKLFWALASLLALLSIALLIWGQNFKRSGEVRQALELPVKELAESPVPSSDFPEKNDFSAVGSSQQPRHETEENKETLEPLVKDQIVHSQSESVHKSTTGVTKKLEDNTPATDYALAHKATAADEGRAIGALKTEQSDMFTTMNDDPSILMSFLPQVLQETVTSQHENVYSIALEDIPLPQVNTQDRDKRFQAQKLNAASFVAMELMTYPSSHSSNFRYIGFSGGLAHQRPFGRNFFYEGGVRLAVRMGEFSPSIQSTQLSFDFGPRENAYQLRPSAVYSMQTPWFVGMQQKRSQVSVGLVPSFLLGVRGTSEFQGQLHPWEQMDSNEGKLIQTLERGWLSTAGFNRFALSGAVRYFYIVSPGFHVGINVRYRPGDWVGEDYGKYFDFNAMDFVVGPNNQQMLISRNWTIGFEMRYGF